MQELLSSLRAGTFALEPVHALSTGTQRLAAGDIDVVLLDLSLPDGSAPVLVAQIRAQAPHVPFIALSDSDGEMLAIQAVQAGAQDYRIKDQVDGNLLARSIRYAIERMQAEEALDESKAEFRNMVENSQDGIIQVDEQGLIRKWNQGQETITGLKRREVIGRHIWEGRFQFVSRGEQTLMSTLSSKRGFCNSSQRVRCLRSAASLKCLSGPRMEFRGLFK